MTAPVLVEVRRGDAVESRHRGVVVVVDARGGLRAACGDPDLRCFARSSIKPLQALPLAADGAVERFGLTDAEIAVVCGSHAGEPAHIQAVRSILDKIGLPEEALRCPGHFPYHEPTAEAMRRRGEAPLPIHDNCSGKHAGMLALARLHGWDPDGYLAPDHPAQQRIREALAAAAGPTAVAGTAVDGCGAPTFHISVRELAAAFARLAGPDSLPPAWRPAASVIAAATAAHPEMMAGTGRFNTEAMRALPGRLLMKGGAEAVMAVGIPGRGLGLALKIEDGGARAAAPAAVEALRQIGLLGGDDLRALAQWARPPVATRGGVPVGEIRPVFALS